MRPEIGLLALLVGCSGAEGARFDAAQGGNAGTTSTAGASTMAGSSVGGSAVDVPAAGSAGLPVTAGTSAGSDVGGTPSTSSAGTAQTTAGKPADGGSGGTAGSPPTEAGAAGSSEAGAGGAAPATCTTHPAKDVCGEQCQIAIEVCPDANPAWTTADGTRYECGPADQPDSCTSAIGKAKAWQTACCG